MARLLQYRARPHRGDRIVECAHPLPPSRELVEQLVRDVVPGDLLAVLIGLHDDLRTQGSGAEHSDDHERRRLLGGTLCSSQVFGTVSRGSPVTCAKASSLADTPVRENSLCISPMRSSRLIDGNVRIRFLRIGQSRTDPSEAVGQNLHLLRRRANTAKCVELSGEDRSEMLCEVKVVSLAELTE